MTRHGPRTLHLNAFLMSTGHHEASWRLPESDPFANTDIRHYQRLAQIAERGKLDSIFFADSPVLWGQVGRRPSGALEPTVLLTAIAAVTERIGLIATASTTYNDPFNLARRFASVDRCTRATVAPSGSSSTQIPYEIPREGWTVCSRAR